MRTLGVALVVVLVLGMTGGPAVADAKTMSAHRAARVYLSAVCPVNAAAQRFDRRLWRGHDYVTVRDVRPRLGKFKREASRYGRAEAAMALTLRHPPRRWPANVARPVAKLADKMSAAAVIRLEQGMVRRANRWIQLNDDANRIKWGRFAAQIRTRLDLPPPRKGC